MAQLGTAVGDIITLVVDVDGIHFHVVGAGIHDGDAALEAGLCDTREVMRRYHVGHFYISGGQFLVCVLVLARRVGIDIYFNPEAIVRSVDVVSPTTHVDAVSLSATNV